MKGKIKIKRVDNVIFEKKQRMHYKCNQTQYPVWLLLSNQPGSLHMHCWWDISQLHTSIVEFTFIDICHSMFSLLWRFSVTGSIRTLRQSFGLLRIHYFLFALHLKVMTWTQDLQESSIKNIQVESLRANLLKHFEKLCWITICCFEKKTV